MKKVCLAAGVAALGLAACSHLREPTDAELAALLRSERAAADDSNAPLDGNAIECLRAWSGDPDLLKGLPLRVAGEDGRKTCRAKLDGWIADGSRNADKLAFADFAAPKAVRRAMELQEQRRLAAMADPSRHEPPPSLTNSGMESMTPPLAPDPSVDLGEAGVDLQEAEGICRKVQAAAMNGSSDEQVRSYGVFCGKNLGTLRKNMQIAARRGSKEALDAYGRSAKNLATNGQRMLDVLAAQEAKNR